MFSFSDPLTLNPKQNMEDAIVEKLSKILRLANGKGVTQGEIEAAMSRAGELARKHNIDLSTIDFTEKNTGPKGIEVVKEELGIRSKTFQLYHAPIWFVFREVFNVRSVLCGYRVVLVGDTTDVMICRMLLPWLEEVFRSTYTKAKHVGVALPCAADKRGIYEGLAQGIILANQREEDKLDPKTKQNLGLVVRSKQEQVQQALIKFFPVLQNVKSRSQGVNAGAYGFGVAEGKKINLAQAGPGKQNQQLKDN